MLLARSVFICQYSKLLNQLISKGFLFITDLFFILNKIKNTCIFRNYENLSFEGIQGNINKRNGTKKELKHCFLFIILSSRRQIEVAPENIMSQSMTTLPHTSPIHPLMTNSFSGVFPKNSPSFSSNLTLTPLHSESRLSGSEHRRSKPAPPPRTTPVNGEVPPPLPPKSAGGERVPPPRPASKERHTKINCVCSYS